MHIQRTTSINPYQMLPYYTPQVIEDHWHPPANKTLMPHTYDIAKRALLGMTLNGENQAILISGESGAGKTECAKQCFSFLAEVNDTLDKFVFFSNNNVHSLPRTDLPAPTLCVFV